MKRPWAGLSRVVVADPGDNQFCAPGSIASYPTEQPETPTFERTLTVTVTLMSTPESRYGCERGGRRDDE